MNMPIIVRLATKADLSNRSAAVALRDFEPLMTAVGQTRSFGDVGSMSGLPESGHGRAIYEYTPFCNGPGDVKSPRVMSPRRAHASVRGRRRGRHTMLSEGTVSLSRYAWFVG